MHWNQKSVCQILLIFVASLALEGCKSNQAKIVQPETQSLPFSCIKKLGDSTQKVYVYDMQFGSKTYKYQNKTVRVFTTNPPMCCDGNTSFVFTESCQLVCGWGYGISGKLIGCIDDFKKNAVEISSP